MQNMASHNEKIARLKISPTFSENLQEYLYEL